MVITMVILYNTTLLITDGALQWYAQVGFYPYSQI